MSAIVSGPTQLSNCSDASLCPRSYDNVNMTCCNCREGQQAGPSQVRIAASVISSIRATTSTTARAVTFVSSTTSSPINPWAGGFPTEFSGRPPWLQNVARTTILTSTTIISQTFTAPGNTSSAVANVSGSGLKMSEKMSVIFPISSLSAKSKLDPSLRR